MSTKAVTRESIHLNNRLWDIAMPIRNGFCRSMVGSKGIWHDQLSFLTTDHRFLSILPAKSLKYSDKERIARDMMALMQSVSIREAIYVFVREMEVNDRLIDTLNIIYIGPHCWQGGAIVFPYHYSHQYNQTFTIESPAFADIGTAFNAPYISMVREFFYDVDDISLKEKVRQLTIKGYRIFDAKTVAKRVTVAISALSSNW